MRRTILLAPSAAVKRITESIRYVHNPVRSELAALSKGNRMSTKALASIWTIGLAAGLAATASSSAVVHAATLEAGYTGVLLVPVYGFSENAHPGTVYAASASSRFEIKSCDEGSCTMVFTAKGGDAA